MRLLAEEGIGADVSTLGELRFALAAGHRGRAGSSCTATTSPTPSSRAAAEAGALVVIDSLEEVDARPRGGRRARR